MTEELAILDKLKVRVHLETELDNPDFPEKCLNDFDAIFLSLEAVDPESWELDAGRQRRGDRRPPSSSAPITKKYSRAGWADSPIWQAAQGRWAATSMDRFLQNVSLTAGREKDGPYDTRLYTSLENVTPLPAIPMSDSGPGVLGPGSHGRSRSAACNANAWNASRSAPIWKNSALIPRNTLGKYITTNPLSWERARPIN